MLPNNARSKERGNVFIFILMGVVLFAALSFTVARGMRGDTASKMSDRQRDLAITEILNYAQRMENTISRLRRNGCSENDISFLNPTVGGYNHTPASPVECRVFESTGGRLTWANPPEGLNDGSPWLFTGTVRLYNLGDPNAPDLMMLLPRISSMEACMEINNQLNVDNLANDAPTGLSSLAENKYQGSFSNTDGIGNVDSEVQDKTSSCFKESNTGDYWFVKVLIIR